MRNTRDVIDESRSSKNSSRKVAKALRKIEEINPISNRSLRPGDFARNHFTGSESEDNAGHSEIFCIHTRSARPTLNAMHGAAYFNGRWIPSNELALPLDDAGIVWGAMVVDRLRTFSGIPFQLASHIERFQRSCSLARIPLLASSTDLVNIVSEVIERNFSDTELSIALLATPGSTTSHSGPGTLIVQAMPIDMSQYRSLFQDGARLKTVAAGLGVNPHIKHRSRLPWWIASQGIAIDDPDVGALFVDPMTATVLETTTSNIAAVIDGAVYAPPSDRTLPGVSLAVVRDLCTGMSVRYFERVMSVSDVQRASEVLLTNTTYCLAGVSWLDGATMPFPGPVLNRLICAFSELVGMDIRSEKAVRR